MYIFARFNQETKELEIFSSDYKNAFDEYYLDEGYLEKLENSEALEIEEGFTKFQDKIDSQIEFEALKTIVEKYGKEKIANIIKNL